MAATNDGRARPAPVDAELAALQSILIGPAARQLDAIQARLDDPAARAAEVAGVLPRVLVTHAGDPEVTRALTPAVERAITTSVRRNPRPLADALFPIMGPAIRKAVSASLAAMIDSVNRTLEHAVSWRSVQWRLEALRTHRSFAEIVLARTLLYRVEQLFLIDRRTGLLLLHVQPGSAAVADADMVSGMLTAIRDFVQDSFRVASGDSLESLKVGDLSVWIDAGPRALVAAVIRGTAPRDLHPLLQEAVEEIHRQFGRDLETFQGDASAFEGARPILERCLTSEYRQESRPRRGAWILFGAIMAALLVWAGLSYRSEARFRNYLDALAAEPGVTVISSERGWRRHVVSGLRDPLARDPQALLAAAGLSPERVDGRWTPYQSLDPALVIRRAQHVLQPPAGAVLTLTDGVLSVTGPVTPSWIDDARRLAPLIGGVSAFDAAGAARAAMRDVRARVEGIALFFGKGTAQLAGGQDDEPGRLLATLTDLDALAGAAGERLTIAIVGHTDADGADDANLPLSRARAETVAALIRARSFRHLDFQLDGAGSREPVVRGTTEAEHQRNRRVSLRLR
jgi:OOP family OmpA-OmpF porin